MCILIGIQPRIPAEAPTPSAYDATAFTIAVFAIMNLLGHYSRNPESISKTVQRLLIAFFFAFFISSAVFYSWRNVDRDIFAISAAMSVVGLLIVGALFFQVSSASVLKRRVTVVGSGEAARELIAYLQDADAASSMQFVGLCSTRGELHPEGKYRDIEHGDRKLEGIRVCDCIAFYEQEKKLLGLDDLRTSWMICGDGLNQDQARNIIKRIFDLVISIFLLIVSIPIVLTSACAIKLESRGVINS